MLDEVDGVDEVDGSMVGDTTSACSIAVIAVQVGVSMKSSGEINCRLEQRVSTAYREVAR